MVAPTQTAEPNVEVLPFSAIDKLEAGASVEAIVNVDFKDKNKPIKFELQYVALAPLEAVWGAAAHSPGLSWAGWFVLGAPPQDGQRRLPCVAGAAGGRAHARASDQPGSRTRLAKCVVDSF